MHEEELRIMKNNLIIFRNALGWSAEYLGNKLGMSKQAISNLENNASQKNEHCSVCSPASHI